MQERSVISAYCMHTAMLVALNYVRFTVSGLILRPRDKSRASF